MSGVGDKFEFECSDRSEQTQTGLWDQLYLDHPEPIDTTGGLIRVADGLWVPESIQHALLASQQETSARDFVRPPDQRNEGLLDGLGYFAFGDEYPDVKEKGYSHQTDSGRAAIQLARDVLAEIVQRDKAQKIPMIIDPGWDTEEIFKEDFDISTYQHLDTEGSYDHDELIRLMESADEGTVVYLQACGYNPDGIDRSEEQWDEILELIKHKGLIPILDGAYLGLAENTEQDRSPLIKCASRGIFGFVCLSTTKNMGMEDHRLGALHVLNIQGNMSGHEADFEQVVLDNVHGYPKLEVAMAIGATLGEEDTSQQYQAELRQIVEEITNRRQKFASRLALYGNDPASMLVEESQGMFATPFPTGFDEGSIVQFATSGVKVRQDGRINIAGLSTEEIARVAEVIAQ